MHHTIVEEMKRRIVAWEKNHMIAEDRGYSIEVELVDIRQNLFDHNQPNWNRRMMIDRNLRTLFVRNRQDQFVEIRQSLVNHNQGRL